MKLGEFMQFLISLEAPMSAELCIEFRNTAIGSVDTVYLFDDGKLLLASDANAVIDAKPAESGKGE